MRPGLASDTVIGVPPFGRVIVDSHTHRSSCGPPSRELDVPALQRLARQSDIEGHLRTSAEHDVGALVRLAIIRLLGVSLVSGAVAGLLIGRRRAASRRRQRTRPVVDPVVAGGAGALLAVTGSVGLVWVSYRVDEFREPGTRASSEHPRSSMPWNGSSATSTACAALAGAGRQINELSQVAVGTGPSPDPGEVRILHISDIHLNPMGLEIAKDLATTFSVRAVVDTGDLTSFGLDGRPASASSSTSSRCPTT